jgi:hypothetical protein
VRRINEQIELVGGAAAAQGGKEVGHVVSVRRGFSVGL